MNHPRELSTPSKCPHCGGTSWTNREMGWQCNGCQGWLTSLVKIDGPRKRRNIETEWEAFRATTIPKDAGPGQIHDQHMAFLSGAVCLQNLIAEHPDKDAEEILKHLNGQIEAAIAANRILAMQSTPQK